MCIGYVGGLSCVLWFYLLCCIFWICCCFCCLVGLLGGLDTWRFLLYYVVCCYLLLGFSFAVSVWLAGLLFALVLWALI